MGTRFPYSPVKREPIPAAIIELHHPAGTAVLSPVSAHLDTAADMTVVPLPTLQRLGVTAHRQLAAKGFGGTLRPLDVFHVRIVIPGVGDFLREVLGYSAEPFVLIGRDILNRYRITFDKPNRVFGIPLNAGDHSRCGGERYDRHRICSIQNDILPRSQSNGQKIRRI